MRVLVYLAVLASATPVSAECAWVLWWTEGRSSHGDVSPTAAFANREACLREAELRTAIIKELMKAYPGKVASVMCLPDTVDPRGPKGSGR